MNGKAGLKKNAPVHGKFAINGKATVNGKPTVNGKASVNGKAATAVISPRVASTAKPAFGKNGSASIAKSNAALPAKAVVTSNAKSMAKTAAPVVASSKPIVGKVEEPPKPTGRPMLLQGPIAIKPMGKRATLPPTPPKPVVKPLKRKPLPSGEPSFVVVQPPTKAVATSEKAAKNRAGLGQKDLDYFRDLVLAKRRELLGDMSHMEREALRENSSDLSNLPVHMADQGTDAYEQEFTLHLVEKDRTLLRELNDALAKIQNGTYGICEGTGLPISKARLEAQPWARYSIEHARVLEKRQMMFRR